MDSKACICLIIGTAKSEWGSGVAEKTYRSIDEITIKRRPLREILENHRAWLESGGSTGSKADLLRADLHKADLRFVDLRSANLRGVDFWRAELSGSNLTRANLRGSNLRQTNLKRALLDGTNLDWADLGGADLSETDLSRAIITTNTKLSGAIGLQDQGDGLVAGLPVDFFSGRQHRKVGHEQYRLPKPSKGTTLGRLESGRKPEQEASPFMLTTETYPCTLSYTEEDSGFSHRLYHDLKARGLACSYSWGTSPLSRPPWAKKLTDREETIVEMRFGLEDGRKHTLELLATFLGLTRERVRQIEGNALEKLKLNRNRMIVVCSKLSLTSGLVIRSIELALLLEEIENRQILLPIPIDNYLFEKWEHDRKETVVDRAGIIGLWNEESQYGRNFEKLIRVLRKDEAEAVIVPVLVQNSLLNLEEHQRNWGMLAENLKSQVEMVAESVERIQQQLESLLQILNRQQGNES